MPYQAEYIWIDGHKPTPMLRSKTKILANSVKTPPIWGFDGSSTEQATGDASDCMLKPVFTCPDPIRGGKNILVLCEVMLAQTEKPHPTNTRALCAEVSKKYAAHGMIYGIEQEYTMMRLDGRPYGFPEAGGEPAPQGPYYCGVGAGRVMGRQIIEEHTWACIEAGLMIEGTNAEVMPGQWEFQIGYRGVNNEDAGLLNVCDQMWIARWLIHLISEKYDIHVSFDNKPIKGDWNGAGMHTNFSTTETRSAKTGKDTIYKAIEKLSKNHSDHIKVYGHNLHERLTGLHETSDIHTFSAGSADRGRSIRIPRMVDLKGYGYFEDRRPGANSDPYLVAARLAATVCDIDESVVTFRSWPR